MRKTKGEKKDGRLYCPLSIEKKKWPDKVMFCFKQGIKPRLVTDDELIKAYALTYRVSEKGEPLDDVAVYTSYLMYNPMKFFRKFCSYPEGAIAIFEKDGSFNTYTFTSDQRKWFLNQFEKNALKYHNTLKILNKIFVD